MMKQQQSMKEQEIRMARRQQVNEMKRRRATGRPSGGGQILLAYGMNKNLKNLQNNGQGMRSRSARPIRGRQIIVEEP
jgi:hypothetical protein